MSFKAIQESIKLSMNIIGKALKQIPQDKRPIITSRVNNVLTKYTKQGAPTTEQQLKKLQKQLQFNLNFIKLSHPKLDFTFSPEQSTVLQEKSKNHNSSNKEQKESKHKFQLTNDQSLEIERLSEDSFDSQLQREKNARQQVEFTNWFDGNVDPQKLKKHKQLLERQHFQGQFWKDKQKPRSMAKQYLRQAMESTNTKEAPPIKNKVLEDFQPRHTDQNDQSWEKVKR